LITRNFGDDSCFLFNITKDSKLLPVREGDSTYLWQGPSSFSFGTYDLQVEENFNEISSEVEVNYVSGRGLSPSEAKAFLTGRLILV
jgi:TLD